MTDYYTEEECVRETIRIQDAEIDQLRAQVEALKSALRYINIQAKESHPHDSWVVVRAIEEWSDDALRGEGE